MNKPIGAQESSARVIGRALEETCPDYIVSMVSGGKDSAASHEMARCLGIPIDLIIHGYTRTGIPQTTQFVQEYYGHDGPDLAIADAGTSYEDYVLRKGFFGKGIGAHMFSYRVLKATPFRRTISREIRQRKRGMKIMLLNGARKDESINRQTNLPVIRADPGAPGNVWVNIIHHWTSQERDQFLEQQKICINPVARELCRSGECMCGTMQTAGERREAAALYPDWGAWLDSLEAEVIAKHGFGWGVGFPDRNQRRQGDLFQPMCSDCMRVT